MTKKITDLEGRLDAALDRADKDESIPHTISLTRAELQDEWDKSSRLVERLTQAVKTLAEERDAARKQRDELMFCACGKRLSTPQCGVCDNDE